MIECPKCGETQQIVPSIQGTGKYTCNHCLCQFDVYAGSWGVSSNYGGSGGSSNSNSSKVYSSPVKMTDEFAIERLENLFEESTDFTDRAAIRHVIETLKQNQKDMNEIKKIFKMDF